MPMLPNWNSAGRITAAATLTLCAAACVTHNPQLATQAALAVRTVDQFQANVGTFPGYRRNHAKGVCISGYFQSNGNAAPYSVAQVFQPGRRSPVIGRLSIPGTNPYAWDASTPIRGMALQLTQPDGSQWRMAMNAVPAFPVATPQANFAFLQAQQPVRATGNPDPAKLAAFFATHPRAKAFRQWVQTTEPSASFATQRYNSLNTFVLIDADGQRQPVRWHMAPTAQADAHAKHPVAPDYLATDLRKRLAHGPLRWHLVITLANADDAIDNAAIPWRGPHRHINAGTLVIVDSQPQATGPCRAINFNPLILPDGIEPSDDPLLDLRAQAYAVSHRRRVREHAHTGRAGTAQNSVQQQHGRQPPASPQE